ncbi:MAG: trigger factor [Firmicutes bacterium HGW-Firmicutes-12]|jgi:trigger factor|nr:MAG: trigger factor [Firmicutes bacterium HGW-Firmicutes-12]
MKVSAEKIEKTKVQVTMEISEDEFEPSLQKAYKIVVNKVNIPGFRKGKAPRRILENMFGKEILLEDALQDAIPKAYIKALAEVKDEYISVSEPQYEMVQTEIDKPIIFKAVFDIKPEVILGKYKGIELDKGTTEVTKEQIEEELSKMQQRYAKLVVSEEAAEEGDVLTIDFVGKVDGQAFEGGTSDNYSLELGSKTFIPGFEEQLIGAVQGECKDVEVSFPEDYHSEDLKGKDAVFTVTVQEIKRKQIATIDDEFAKDVSEFASVQELRQDIENRLLETLKKKVTHELQESAISKAAATAEVEIPKSMIDNRINSMIEEFAFRLQQQGITMEYYFEATGNNIQDMMNSYRPGAEAAVRADLVLEAIIKAEGIQATSEDIDKEIQKIAEQYKQEPSAIRDTLEKQGQISSLEFGIMAEKAVDLIISEAKITEVTVTK